MFEFFLACALFVFLVACICVYIHTVGVPAAFGKRCIAYASIYTGVLYTVFA